MKRETPQLPGPYVGGACAVPLSVGHPAFGAPAGAPQPSGAPPGPSTRGLTAESDTQRLLAHQLHQVSLHGPFNHGLAASNGMQIPAGQMQAPHARAGVLSDANALRSQGMHLTGMHSAGFHPPMHSAGFSMPMHSAGFSVPMHARGMSTYSGAMKVSDMHPAPAGARGMPGASMPMQPGGPAVQSPGVNTQSSSPTSGHLQPTSGHQTLPYRSAPWERPPMPRNQSFAQHPELYHRPAPGPLDAPRFEQPPSLPAFPTAGHSLDPRIGAPGGPPNGLLPDTFNTPAFEALADAGVPAHAAHNYLGHGVAALGIRRARTKPRGVQLTDRERKERHNEHTRSSRLRIDEGLKKLRNALLKVNPALKLTKKADIVEEAFNFVEAARQKMEMERRAREGVLDTSMTPSP